MILASFTGPFFVGDRDADDSPLPGAIPLPGPSPNDFSTVFPVMSPHARDPSVSRVYPFLWFEL